MKLVLYWRLARIVAHVFLGMLICGAVFPWAGPQRHDALVRRWSRRLLGLCNVRLATTGAAPLAHAMVVANHVSWLDIFVINSVYPCRFVAKAEIRAWPMLGWLAAGAGTVFIARGDRRGLRHLFTGLVDKLRSGERIAFFPEGTTAAHGTLLPFHPNLFEAAIDAGVPVQPLALAYADPLGAVPAALDFTGDTSVQQSVLAILGGPPVTASVAFLAPLTSVDAHRRDLAAAARQAVAAALGMSTAGEGARRSAAD
ncbi:MAG: lysophospholipid acyltransferase family protein [Pseudomonadota bacterium]